ncbi:hypothetical protein ACWEO4_38945 [Streptomyces sp. NPDC004393]
MQQSTRSWGAVGKSVPPTWRPATLHATRPLTSPDTELRLEY